jgi:signal transduction histidine kinase
MPDESRHAEDAHRPPGFVPVEALGDRALTALLGASADGVLFLDADQQVLYANDAASKTFDRPAASLRGRALTSFLDKSACRLLAKPGAATEGRCRLARVLRDDGDHREVDLWSSVIECEGRSYVAVTLHDTTEARRNERAAAALSNIASALVFDQPIEVTLKALAARALESTEAVACAVVLIKEDPLRITFVGSAGDINPDWGPTEAAWRAGFDFPSLRAFRERRPVVATNVRQQVLDDPLAALIHDDVRRVSWDNVAIMPLVRREETLGVFGAYYAPGVEPDHDELSLVQAIAKQAATAVQNAHLFAESQAAAALEERQRLAHELHDSVSQALFGISLGAHTALSLLERDAPKAADAVDYVLSLADAGLAEMRALLFELRPDSLEQEGLCAALTKQAAAVRARYRVDVEESLELDPAVTTEVRQVLYHSAQEALRNVVKHGHAKNVRLRLFPSGADVILEVRDDGRGFDPSVAVSGKTGLQHLALRASRLGGVLQVESTPGRGTVVRVRLPAEASAVSG